MNMINCYVVTHKNATIPQLKGYIPMIVGKSQDFTYPNALRDNTGDQISEKNPNYCELTALYWIWKNTNDSVVGLCHYRRYFTRNSFTDLCGKVLSGDLAINYLKHYDIILPYPFIMYPHTVYEQLRDTSVKEADLHLLRKQIAQKYPDYLDAYDEVMNGHKICCYNMLITHKKLLNEYCEWLFDILFSLEACVDLRGQNDYEQRIYGFLSERLLNVWVKYKGLRIKYLHVLETEKPSTLFSCIKRWGRYQKHHKLLK